MGIGRVVPSHAVICRLARRTSEGSLYRADEVQRILRYGAPVGSTIEHFQCLPRCMDILRNRVTAGGAEASIATGAVVRADELSDSSGRFDRIWHAPPGGLYLAILWADTLLPEFSRLLPFAVGIACCETVRSYGVAGRIKWVNDVHVEGRKIAGILSEVVYGAHGEQFHLIGVGLNVNTTDFPPELGDQATSLRRETEIRLDLDAVFNLLLARLQWNFGLLCLAEEQALATGRKEFALQDNPLLLRWRKLSDSCGKTVLYGYDVQKQPLYRAKVLDIDGSGGLIMQLEDGSRLTEYSGEILYLDENSTCPCLK